MKIRNIFAAATISATLMTSFAAMADPVYMIAQIEIEKPDEFFNGYGAAAYPSLVANEAKVLVATQDAKVLEGKWVGNWTVVIEFPNQEKADTWYKSEDYQTNAIPIRLGSTKFTNMVFAPTFEALPQ